ncbi:MAG TPA: glycosyltransferase [Candidatus Limnocylindrales bacterium]|nr:glycosyltransferase [Candidatus Limnocylindrales bacterium]
MLAERRTALVGDINFAIKGGSQESTKNMFEFGTDWFLVTPHDASSLVVNSRRTPSVKIPFSHQYLPSPMEARRVALEIERYDPEHLIINHPDFYTGSLFLALPKSLRRRSHALWRAEVDRTTAIREERPLKAQARKAVKGIQQRMQRYVGNNVSSNLVVSEALVSSLENIGIHNNIRVIPEQIGGEFSPAVRSSEGAVHERRKYLDDDELGVLIVTRLSSERGLSWLPKLIESLRKERRFISPESPYRKLQVAVAGQIIDGQEEYVARVMEEINAVVDRTGDIRHADSITFRYLGKFDRVGLQKIYNAYDVLFHPSPSDGFGRVAVEAMSAGMTVITRTDNKAASEIIQNPPYAVGDIVDSPEELARRLLHQMQDSELLRSLQQQALRWASGHYSLKTAEEMFWNALSGQM